MFSYKIKLNKHFTFDAKIPKVFCQILLSIMSLRSMIHLYPIRRNKTVKTVSKHYLHLNLTIHDTRDCVFLFHQFQPWSDLVLRKLYQRKNNIIKKKLSRSLWHGLLTFAALEKIILFIFCFYQSFLIKTLTFWYQNG